MTISDSANNIVLFPHAASVEGADGEVRRTIRGVYPWSNWEEEDDEPDDGNEPRPREQRVFFDQLPPPRPAAPPAPSPLDDDDDWFFGVSAVEPDPPQASLRLLVDEISIVTVSGVRYDIERSVVSFADHEPEQDREF